MDTFDRKILQRLQQDGRISNQQLADAVGLSTAACWRRVKALEQQGVIRRYTALLDPDQLGQSLCVFAMVSLERHSVDHSRMFEQAMQGCPQVLQCFAVTGSADFLLQVRVADISAYDQFLNEQIFPLPGINQIHSNFALREIKADTRIELA